MQVRITAVLTGAKTGTMEPGSIAREGLVRDEEEEEEEERETERQRDRERERERERRKKEMKLTVDSDCDSACLVSQ